MKGLRWIRERRGLTLQQIEDLTGISFNTISRYERGVISPNTDTALKIAQALGVTVDELLNGSANQEFEVKIIMGVKNLPNATGIEIKDNSCIYGIDDEKPLIHMALNNADIGTPEKREDVFKKLVAGFLKACWMNDHRGEAAPEMPDVSAILSMIQPA